MSATPVVRCWCRAFLLIVVGRCAKEELFGLVWPIASRWGGSASVGGFGVLIRGDRDEVFKSDVSRNIVWSNGWFTI